MRLLPILLCLPLVLVGCGEGDGTSTEASELDVLAYGVSQIFIPVDPKRPDGQAETLIRQAARALANGDSFASVARGRSDHQSAPDGGFVGFVSAHSETSFSGAVQATRPGQVSSPIKTRYGWHIIKRHPFEEARALEKKLRVPTHGIIVAWDNPENRMAMKTGRTKEQAYAEAMQVMQKLGSGDLSLEQAQAIYTPPQQRRPQAYLGLTERHGDNEHIFDALKAAETNQLLGPYDTPKGFAVVMRGKYLRSLFRHILIQHVGSEEREGPVTRTREQALDIAERVLKQVLADRSKWNSLVEAHSDDRYSRSQAGRMGVLDPAIMPEGFASFAYDQPVGSIHPKVVETPFGFHIVWKVN